MAAAFIGRRSDDLLRMFYLHNIGIKLLALFYFGAGASIGEPVRHFFQGRGRNSFGNPTYFFVSIGANLVAIGCLVFVRRRAVAESPMRQITSPLVMLVRGLPVTNRVAFLLCTTTYIIGLVIGFIFAI